MPFQYFSAWNELHNKIIDEDAFMDMVINLKGDLKDRMQAISLQSQFAPSPDEINETPRTVELGKS